MEITFDEWRQDVLDIEGVVLQANVLFIRATKGDIQYQVPVFDEDSSDIKDVKDLLAMRVQRHGT